MPQVGGAEGGGDEHFEKGLLESLRAGEGEECGASFLREAAGVSFC
jgi:hypothetical protein